jgi:hypothetical protein
MPRCRRPASRIATAATSSEWAINGWRRTWSGRALPHNSPNHGACAGGRAPVGRVPPSWPGVSKVPRQAIPSRLASGFGTAGADG